METPVNTGVSALCQSMLCSVSLYYFVSVFIVRNHRAFGEMAVLDGERRSATCIAASNCQLLNLGKDSLEKMLNDAPKIAAKIIRALAVSLSKRLRMADGQLAAQQV